jgi:hypothetical protein
LGAVFDPLRGQIWPKIGQNRLGESWSAGDDEDYGVCSAIEALARVLHCWPDEGWRDVKIAMLSAFDASGQENRSDALVVGGFVSSAEHWAEFSRQWIERLSRDGLEYFHRTEIEHRVPKSKHNALFGDLMKIIKRNAYRKFVWAVLTKKLTDALSGEDKIREHIGAYSVAGTMCAKDVEQWMYENGMRSAPAHVFEEGDIGAGKLRDAMILNGMSAPVFRPGKRPKINSSGVTIQPFVPLQAADFIAGEYFMHVSRKISGSDFPMRRGLKEFESMPGYAYAVDRTAVEALPQVIGATKYLEAIKEGRILELSDILISTEE